MLINGIVNGGHLAVRWWPSGLPTEPSSGDYASRLDSAMRYTK